MSENRDAGASGFEERLRDLLADGATERVVSASAVIDGARRRRRRMRQRTAAAGSSLAVLAVLGVAAGAIAFGGGHVGGAGGSSGAAGAVTQSAPSSSGHPGPKTCSASVTGTVPGTVAVTLDRLVFQTVSGKTAGVPWSVQIHVFPDAKSHMVWQAKLPAGTIPPGENTAIMPGAVAQFRSPDVQGYTEVGASDGTPGDGQYFTIQEGMGIGPRATAKPTEQAYLLKDGQSYTAYVTSGWMGPDVDHLCVQYTDHAEFEPVYRIQGGRFYVFGYPAADRPQKVFGYNAAGTVVGSATATKSGHYFLVSLSGSGA